MTTFLSCVKAAFEMCSELFKNNEMDVQQMMFLSFFLQSKSVTGIVDTSLPQKGQFGPPVGNKNLHYL